MFSKKIIGISSSSIVISSFLIDRIINKNKKENIYSYDEVSKHNKINNAWVTYGKNVYDVSKFVESHPEVKIK